jgi:hypothetical protein
MKASKFTEAQIAFVLRQAEVSIRTQFCSSFRFES